MKKQILAETGAVAPGLCDPQPVPRGARNSLSLVALLAAIGWGSLSGEALAAECQTANGTTGGTLVVNGGNCSIPTMFNPRDNDGQVGGAYVDGGATVTLLGLGTDIEQGDPGQTYDVLGAFDLTANGKERLLLGSQTQGVSTPDPITGTRTVVATYDSANFTALDWGQYGAGQYHDVGDNQYYNARLGTVSGGKLVVDIGDATQAPDADDNAIYMASKATNLTEAIGAGSTVEWTSRNLIMMGVAATAPPGVSSTPVTMQIPQYTGSFTGFDGQTYTVNSAADLKTYNDRLIAALQSGAISTQAGYDAAFNQAVSFTSQDAHIQSTITPGDDVTLDWGFNNSIYVSGAGAMGIIKSGGQIDQRNGSVTAENGGYIEVESGGQLSGNYHTLNISSGSYGVNNGVISGGFFAEDNFDTTGPGNYDNAYPEAWTVTVDGATSIFDNNGIINVAGWDWNNVNQVDQYGISLSHGAASTNTGIINVGVNNNAANGTISGVVVNDGSFTNASGSMIYIGRAAQYDVNSPGADTTNEVPQYGVRLYSGDVTNNGNIVVGTQTQNATAMAAINATPDSSLINNAVIDIKGVAPDSPLQNVGMFVSNSATTTLNSATGTINLEGTNGVGMRVIEDAGVATSATTDGIITVAGGADPASGTRSFGMWVQGDLAVGNVNGEVNLTGIGSIGVHARDAGIINVAKDTVAFLRGSDQIGFFAYGEGSMINLAAKDLTVGTARSVLFRVENGADFTGASSGGTFNIDVSGEDARGVVGTGAGTLVNTGAATFTVSGAAGGQGGAAAVLVEGGAVGIIAAASAVNLTGTGAIAGIVDGQKHDLFGADVGTPDPTTRLDSAAVIVSNAAAITGYIARKLGTLNDTADIRLSGAGSTGILAQDSGRAVVDGANVDVNGWAAKAQRGTDSFTLTGATMTGSDGLFDVGGGASASFAADASKLNGIITTAADSTADIRLTGGTQWLFNGNSNMTMLDNNASTILFAPEAPFGKITTHDYVGTSGTMVLNTYLDTDGAPSDQLVIDGGSATGTTTLVVNNSGGPGNYTDNGIKVVDAINAGTTAPTAFAMNGPVIAGAFSYNLFRGPRLAGTDAYGDAQNTDDWYLRSQVKPVTPPNDDPGEPPVTPPPGPLYQPGAPIYEAYPGALLGLNGVPTLRERVGNRVWNALQHPSEPKAIYCKDPAQHFQCAVTDEQAGYYLDPEARNTTEGSALWGLIEATHAH
ncbi:MAG TPA: autotransporter outer membrane beta-barrel domain-containing protein, partial [Devosiaceae bacterium]